MPASAKGDEIHVLDLKTFEYGPGTKSKFASVDAAKQGIDDLKLNSKC